MLVSLHSMWHIYFNWHTRLWITLSPQSHTHGHLFNFGILRQRACHSKPVLHVSQSHIPIRYLQWSRHSYQETVLEWLSSSQTLHVLVATLTSPTVTDWTLWQRALTQRLNLRKALQLSLPLRKWWPLIWDANGWSTNADGAQLHCQHKQEWMAFTPIPLHRCTRSFNAKAIPVEPEHLPMQLNHATMYGNIITVTGHRSIDPDNVMRDEDHEDQFWDTWQCEFTIEGHADLLVQAIQKNKAVAVSDGSYWDQHGAAACTIKGETASNHICGTGLTPGYPEGQSA